MSKQERQSNIELLRIISMFGIIILHYNNTLIGKAFTYAAGNEVNYNILFVLESIFICGVDLFMIISGYFMSFRSKRNVWKVIELVVQVIIFSLLNYSFENVIFHYPITINGLINCLVPNNYFVILYSTVYLISPLINLVLRSVSPETSDKIMIMIIIVFLLYPTAVDVFQEMTHREFIGLSSVGIYGSHSGYTFINFAVMYMIGAYLRKREDKIKQIPRTKILILFVVCAAIITIWAKINKAVGSDLSTSAWEYCNPVVALEAVTFFLIFLKFNIGSNKIINNFSTAAFSVFLIQSSVLTKIEIEKYAAGNPVIMIIHILIVTILIYFSGWLIHHFYHFAMDPLFRILEKHFNLTFDFKKNNTERTEKHENDA